MSLAVQNMYKTPDVSLPVALATAEPARRESRRESVSVPASDSGISPEQLSVLNQQGFPTGLARELGNSKIAFPIRWWVVDNSGSMRANDGHIVRGNRGADLKIVSCSRWTELQSTTQYHIDLAALLRMPTIFRMLNDPGTLAGPQEFSIADGTTGRTISEEVAKAKSVIHRCEPKGVTPLAEHLREISSRIRELEPTLRHFGQQAVVVLATDGLPSDVTGRVTDECKQEFIECLGDLQTLPVWVVVRLCTDDAEVVEYYNSLDQTLEMPLEVIDDFLGESVEIHRVNPWLNYALPIHR
jgi:hypothetical protein